MKRGYIVPKIDTENMLLQSIQFFKNNKLRHYLHASQLQEQAI